jgi:antitoxin (DNA-binding transcriptional repressor) of toxin-antitoxin stability system
MSDEPRTVQGKVAQLTQELSALLPEVGRGDTRVIVEEGGAPLAALVSLEDLRHLRTWDERRSRQFAILDEIRAAFADVPDEELEREVDRAFQEARAAARKPRPSAKG